MLKGRLPHVDIADKRLRGGAQIDDLTFVMSQEEIEQGMTLLCMTRPVSDVTVETQSDWGYSLGVGEWKGPTGHILGAPLTLVLNLTNSRPPGGHALASVPVPIFRTGMQTARGLVRPARAAESAGPPPGMPRGLGAWSRDAAAVALPVRPCRMLWGSAGP